MGNVLGCKPDQGGNAGRKERAGQKGTAPAAAKDATAAPKADQQTALPSDAKIIFVLGGPGSGKGTQCAKIVKKYGHTHLSAGDLLRDEVASGSELGKQCQEIMKEGKLVSMEVIIGLLRAAMVKSGAKNFLIDGFPRALDQAECFESMVKQPEMVLAFDCPEEVMEERLLKRGRTSGRADDNAETIRKRFKTFVEQSKPVIDHYLALGKCYNISAVDSPDAVFAKVEAAIEGKTTAPPAATASAAPQVIKAEGELAPDASIMFVLGGPGSGKGTQCAKIVEKYGYTHLSAGDLLRDEVASGSELGQQCQQIMKEGKLVAMEVIIGLLRNAMIRSGAKNFLIDGFPRELSQAYTFEDMIKPCKLVLAFDCPEEVMEERLLKRGQTSGRADDNAETIRKRFKTFVEQSKPVIDHYLALGKCHNISAVDSPDAVFAKVCAVLEPAVSAALTVTAAPAAGSRPASGKAQQQEQQQEEVLVGAPQLAFA